MKRRRLEKECFLFFLACGSRCWTNNGLGASAEDDSIYGGESAVRQACS